MSGSRKYRVGESTRATTMIVDDELLVQVRGDRLEEEGQHVWGVEHHAGPKVVDAIEEHVVAYLADHHLSHVTAPSGKVYDVTVTITLEERENTPLPTGPLVCPHCLESEHLETVESMDVCCSIFEVSREPDGQLRVEYSGTRRDIDDSQERTGLFVCRACKREVAEIALVAAPLRRNEYRCKAGHEWEEEHPSECDSGCPVCRTMWTPVRSKVVRS